MVRLLALAPLLLGACATLPAPTALPTPLTWSDLTDRARPSADATVAYGSDPYQRVDVWIPTGPGPHPTILMVHGGCWTTAIADRTLMDWVADDLRRDGYAVWNIDYRGIDRPGGGYPGTFRDVATAADALRDHAARFSLNADRVVAVGHSAGGHLALWLAARPRLPVDSPLWTGTPLPIAHVISLGGLPDLEATAAAADNGCGTDVVRGLVGPSPTERRDVYRDTSIPRLLPVRVPFDQVVGDSDRIIPDRLPRDFDARAREAGDRATLRVVPRTGHVELVAPETPAWAETKRHIARAFAR